MSNDNEVELSPGFFDLNNPMNNADMTEISNLIPDKINVENANTTNDAKNFVVEFVTLMVFNTTTSIDKSCGCNGGWSRTSTY
jgi:hypothetical protein